MNDYIALYDSRLKKKCDIDCLMWNKSSIGNYLEIVASRNLLIKENILIDLDDVVLLHQAGAVNGYRVVRKDIKVNHDVIFCDDIFNDFHYYLLRGKGFVTLPPIEHIRKIISYATNHGSEFWRVGSTCLNESVRIPYKDFCSVYNTLFALVDGCENLVGKQLKYSIEFDCQFVVNLVFYEGANL